MEEIGISGKELFQNFRINRAILLLVEEPNANLAVPGYLELVTGPIIFSIITGLEVVD